LNTTNWLVTAPSATGTPNVIHCGPGSTSGGSVCVATYPTVNSPNGIQVTLTAPAQAGVSFGGWSVSCTPSNSSGTPLTQPPYWTAAGPNYCTVTLGTTGATPNSSNVTVGAIFN